MQKMNLKTILKLTPLALVLTLMLPAVVLAQTNCSGTLTGTYDNVNVNGGSCTLSGATVRGSVLVTSGGQLTVENNTQVDGSIEAESGGTIKLQSVTVLGSVSLKESGDLTVGSGATVDGTISVEKGSGTVRVIGATSGSGDFKVIEQQGNVIVKDSTLSDVTVEKSSGNVTLSNVTTDSDTKFVENDGNVKITQSSLGSDVEIKENGRVTIKNSSFALEDVKIEKNDGPIVIKGNVDLSLSIIENKNVTVANNTFTDAEVSKNSDGVSIVDNTGQKLNCSDNSPAPTGSGNTITELADGQCAGF